MSGSLSIGGSEAAAAVGLDPFKSRVRLWAEKTGKIVPEEPGEWALWGNLLQPVIAQEVESRGYAVLPAPADPYLDGFMHGHLDGFTLEGRQVTGKRQLDGKHWIAGQVLEPTIPGEPSEWTPDGRGVLEVKTTGPFRGGEWADDAAPPQYVIQCHWYMKLTGLNWSLLACLIGGQRLELRRIERDPEIERMMLAAAEEFVDFCERDAPPPPDGSDSTTDLLKALYPNAVEGLAVEATADDYWTACELAKVKAQRKAVEAEEARLENALKLRLEEADTLTYEGATIARWPLIRGERRPSPGGPYEYRRFTVAVKP